MTLEVRQQYRENQGGQNETDSSKTKTVNTAFIQKHETDPGLYKFVFITVLHVSITNNVSWSHQTNRSDGTSLCTATQLAPEE